MKPSVETVEQFIARGGKITICPSVGAGMDCLMHRGVVKSVRKSPAAGWIAIVIEEQHRYPVQLSGSVWPLKYGMPVKGDRIAFDVSISASGKRFCRVAKPELESVAVSDRPAA